MRHHYYDEVQPHRSPLGVLLARVRRELDLEMEQVSWATSIPSQQLYYMEQGAFERIPEEVYRTHILRTYSGYLGLSWDAVREWYEEERVERGAKEPTSRITTLQHTIPATHFWDTTRIVKHASLVLVVLAGVGYLSWLGYYAVKPPELVVVSPTNNLVSDREAVLVEGYTKGAVSLSINGISVAHDKEGRFSQEVTLAPGMNMLTIAAAKRYSHQAVVTRQIMWTSQYVPVANPAPTSKAEESTATN